MKVELKNQNFRTDYLNNILTARGVTDIQLYKNPNITCLNSYQLLDNIEKGVALIKKFGSFSERIVVGLVVDCDTDGYTSAAIIQQYLEKLFNWEFRFYIHEGKQHGLSDVIEQIIDTKPNLVICPDSSSNDYEYHEILKQYDIPVLVLDHHILSNQEQISDNAIIINNQTSPRYPNKDLTGAGITYQFCRALDKEFNQSEADNYIDLAALGICGDMGSILSLENRYIMKYGFENIINPFFKSLTEKQDYSMGGKINCVTVAFYIVPLINAMIRVGTLEEKINLYYAFIRGHDKIISKKRGSNGALEERCIESSRECTNAKSKQQRLLEKAEEEIINIVLKEGLNENKILVINLDELDFPSELNGLLAMRMAEKFKRPTIIGRVNTKGEFRGSIRGLNNSELKDFRNFLLKSGLFNYVEGHAQAAGYGLQASKIKSLMEYSNLELKDVDFGSNIYEANFSRIAADEDLILLINELGDVDDLWGTNCYKPKIEVKDINLSKKDIQIIGSKKDTVKFEKNGIVYIKFRAQELIDELNFYSDNVIFHIVGEPSINFWGGYTTSQILISSYEIEEDLFGF